MADPRTESPIQLLQEIGHVFDAAGIPWATIGALAVAYHGWIRASLDADALITLKGTGSNLDSLAKVLREKGWKVETRLGEPDDPLGFVVRVEDDQDNMVDLVGGIPRLDPGFFHRTLRDRTEGLDLVFASAEDLIALKVYAGSPMDLEDARKVLKASGSKLDRSLILTLCSAFGEEEGKRAQTLLAS
jgi:hypothetical protein